MVTEKQEAGEAHHAQLQNIKPAQRQKFIFKSKNCYKNPNANRNHVSRRNHHLLSFKSFPTLKVCPSTSPSGSEWKSFYHIKLMFAFFLWLLPPDSSWAISDLKKPGLLSCAVSRLMKHLLQLIKITQPFYSKCAGICEMIWSFKINMRMHTLTSPVAIREQAMTVWNYISY